MALTLLTRQDVLKKYVSLSDAEKELLREIATNYLFDMAMAIHVDFKVIDSKDILFKALDFVAAGWEVSNANESRWRYIG